MEALPLQADHALADRINRDRGLALRIKVDAFRCCRQIDSIRGKLRHRGRLTACQLLAACRARRPMPASNFGRLRGHCARVTLTRDRNSAVERRVLLLFRGLSSTAEQRLSKAKTVVDSTSPLQPRCSSGLRRAHPCKRRFMAADHVVLRLVDVKNF
jgi:hypothetical protein